MQVESSKTTRPDPDAQGDLQFELSKVEGLENSTCSVDLILGGADAELERIGVLGVHGKQRTADTSA